MSTLKTEADPAAGNPQSSSKRNISKEPKPGELVAFGSAQSVFDLQNVTMNTLLLQILNMVLHINPVLVGGLLTVRSFVDAITDPLMGHVTDSTRTRWGRRRPYILVGGILTAVVMVAMWQFDRNWDHQTIANYMGVAIVMLAIATTVQNVSYGALTFEMSPSYHGRTRVQVYRAYCQKVLGLANPWWMPIAMLPLFGDGLTGMRSLSFLFATIMVLVSVACFKFCHERTELLPLERSDDRGFVADVLSPIGKFFVGIWSTITNIHFAKVTMIYMTLLFLLGVFQAYGSYLTIYYLFDGDLLKGSAFHGGAGTLGAVFGFLAIPFASMLSRRYEKHIALKICITCMAFGSASNYWFYQPDYPWLLYLAQPFYSIGIAALFVLLGSLFNDVIDVDDLKNGVRREGLFSATSGFFMKLAGSAAGLCTGLVLNYTRFDAALGGDQPEGTYQKLLFLYSFGPVALLLICIALLWRYPLTEKRISEIQTQLHERNERAGSV
ncbi:MFS transporter [Pelagicoccus mobilis]|uniref:MFS transporter n=1 Tax=Pelagicoccus mobilis TaxID=415221 RepID=A0A934VKN5_9BACT|nr:MFS transporter [Pelagicoccus mobilis]MBK1876876.1 MFS transporter [Pelagicoccus mobilis]